MSLLKKIFISLLKNIHFTSKKIFISLVHHLEFLISLGGSQVLFCLFLLHLLFSFLLPFQGLKTCRVLKSPLLHQSFIILLFFIFLLFNLFFFHKIVHHRIVLFLLLFLDWVKFLICLRISLLVFFLSNLKIFRLNDVIIEVNIVRELKVKLRELMCFEVIEINLLEFERVIGFIFKFFHHFSEQFSTLVTSPTFLDD